MEGEIILLKKREEEKDVINLEAGYYTVQVKGEKIQSKREDIILKDNQRIEIVIKPKTSGLIIYRKINNTSNEKDQDLTLEILTRSGDKCVVNFLNQECPYAHYE